MCCCVVRDLNVFSILVLQKKMLIIQRLLKKYHKVKIKLK